jgi:hypothetical protein
LPLKVLGVVTTTICLEQLLDVNAKIDFQVILNEDLLADIVVGRDFLSNHGIAVLYDPSAKAAKENLKLIKQVASADVIIRPPVFCQQFWT